MMRTQLIGSMNRRGVVLLVVITLLTLFAVVGLSFVLYANATAEGSRLYRESETESRPGVDPELLFALFLGQFLYDAPDDQSGVYSALRGHSLARSMFGLNYDPAELNTNRPAIAARNSVPFNGLGRLRRPLTLPVGQADEYHLINYTYFPQDRFLRDPERVGMRVGRVDPLQLPRQPFQGGWNASYTYPDLNNMYLAAVKADGSVMLPSFHRPWAGFGSLDPNNPNWKNVSNPLLKYLVLRPRPADHARDALGNELFPFPQDAGGDVKNLIGYPGTLLPDGTYANNDSIWLDLDAPVIQAPDGRKYKALFAPLIMDLDNRVNLNVHGNARPTRGPRLPGRPHASNQGWGPWEVNPCHLGGPIEPGAALTPKQAEWANLVTGTLAPLQAGRIRRPGGNLVRRLGPVGRIYSPVDLDGGMEGTSRSSDAPRPPGQLPTPPWQCFPNIPQGYGNGTDPERFDHLMGARPFAPSQHFHYFPLSNVEALLRYGDTGSPALTSELFRLAPLNFGDRTDPDAIRRRNLVTAHSCDVDRPGVVPFYWNVPFVGRNQHLTMPDSDIPPSGARIPFPRLGTVLPDPLGESDFAWGNLLQPSLRASDQLSLLRRLNLNRPLPPYPNPVAATGMFPPGNELNFQVAQRARQLFAEEIFERLWRLTGAGNPADPLARFSPPRWQALRWLAQLAVNIVDFIDPDEYMTPFQWAASVPPFFPAEWVYGTELPRLVLNEVYAQCDNYIGGGSSNYAVNFWVELHNPLGVDAALTHGGGALLRNQASSVYMLSICGREHPLRDPRNVRGDPPPFGQLHWTDDLSPPGVVVQPSNGAYAGPVSGNTGFYVVGPDLNGVLVPGAQPSLPVSYASTRMTMLPVRGENGLNRFTVVLRRLACPHLRFNDDSRSPFYNPYISVDYLENIKPHDGRTLVEGRDPAPVPWEGRSSWGRKQPYAAAYGGPQEPKPWPNAVIPERMPPNSFFQHNVDSDTPGPNWPQQPPPPPGQYPPFDWLVHLDRPLISPMELLHVSAFKPHELTQQFVLDEQGQQKYKHRAPWFDEHIDRIQPSDPTRSLRLNRLFEYVTTGHLSEDMGTAWVASLNQPLLAAAPDPQGWVTPFAMSGPTRSGGTWSIDHRSTVQVRSIVGTEWVRVEEVFPPAGVPTKFRANFLLAHSGFLEILPSRLSDRIPGKINVNTIWDLETFLALCDPQPANEYNLQEVKDIFETLVKQRTPGHLQGQFSTADRPFLGMGVGNAAGRGHQAYDTLYPRDEAAAYRSGTGFEDTFFRSATMNDVLRDPRLLHVLGGQLPDHPYIQNQLLHKIFNHLTTRSNVFAVWVTVGLFEVKDDTTRPAKLGQELVLANGSTVRHRMFAVVDRSVMAANPGPLPRFRLSNNPASAWTTGLVVPYYSIIQ